MELGGGFQPSKSSAVIQRSPVTEPRPVYMGQLTILFH